MIKTFKIKKSDEQLISEERDKQTEFEKRIKQDSFDYSKVIVKK